jgi:putative hemolysin
MAVRTFMPMTEKFIDVEKIIASKNPGLLKWFPGFLLRYIKRILHEDELNDFMARNGHLRNLEFTGQILKEFGTTLDVKGLENLPLEGGYIVAANHPLGGLDGVAFMHAVGMKRPDLKFLVNDLLMNLKAMNDLFIPVNKHGSQYAMDAINNAYASEHPVLVFPAGLVSRKQGGEIRDLVWKKSFINQAIKNKKLVIPTYIKAQNSSFFYNLEVWRRRLRIKANIGMFYLVNEMYKHRGKTITITFGKPITPEVFSNEASVVVWSERMKEHVYELGAGKPGLPVFNQSSTKSPTTSI